MKRTLTALVLVMQLSVMGFAQRVETRISRPGPPQGQPQPSQQQQERERQRPRQPRERPAAGQPSQEQSGDDDVVRVTTNLIQVDAVVTDKKGQTVSDLKAEDFELLEDGKPRPITNFSFIELAPRPGTLATNAPAEKRVEPMKNAPPVPIAPLRTEQVRRTIALVVDDLRMSFASVGATQDALKKFINEQLQPGDLVAILRTSAGVGALEQFTSNREQLLAAVKRVRWSPRDSNSIYAIDAVRRNDLKLPGNKVGGGQPSGQEAINDAGTGDQIRNDEQRQKEISDLREQIFTVGTLGTLNYVVRGLKELPGRKAVVLFSDGLRLDGRDGARLIDPLNKLIDLANRSAVTFYALDARGLTVEPYMYSAGDDLTASISDSMTGIGGAPQSGEQRMDDRLIARWRNYIQSKGGLDFLATQTGGFFGIYLDRGLRQVMEDQRGYYLLGYRPDEETFDPDRVRFHKITVRVKRPNLRVRSRTGFFNVTDDELRSVAYTRDEKLMGALLSPFASGSIDVRLTSLFLNDEQAGSLMRSFLHLDARDLSFTQEPDGSRKVVIDVAAITFGESGKLVDSFNRTHTIRVTEPMYKAILRRGLSYEIAVPVKKAGPYQMRIAVRDAASDRTGSVGQFIEVPDLSKGRLTLSGLLLDTAGSDAAGAALQPAPAGGAPQTIPAQDDPARATSAASAPAGESDSAVRRVRLGAPLDYGYVIYNAKLDKATGRPQLTRHIRLFRQGLLISATQPQPLDLSRQTDLKRMLVAERLGVTGLTPGEYILQVIVTDTLVKDKYATSSQWIDFEVVK